MYRDKRKTILIQDIIRPNPQLQVTYLFAKNNKIGNSEYIPETS